MCVIDEPARTCIAASLPSNRARAAPDLRRRRGLRCCAPARGDAAIGGWGPQVDDAAQAESVPYWRHEGRHLLSAQVTERASGHLHVRARRAELLRRPAASQDRSIRRCGSVGCGGASSAIWTCSCPAGDVSILGEASSSYTKLPLAPGVSERIAAFNPEARFIYLLRDPVERAISHYWHMVRHHAEHRPIAEAVRRDPQFVAVSHYSMQLRPFLEQFGRERVSGAGPRAAGRRSNGRDGRRVSMARRRRGCGRPVRVLPARERNPGRGQHAGLGRCPEAAAAGAGPEERRGAAPASGSPDAASPDHAGGEPANRRRDGSGGFPAPEQRRQTDDLARLLGRSFPEWTTLCGASSNAATEPAAGGAPERLLKK